MTQREARFDGPPDNYWTPPDDIDAIRAQERFEESDAFSDAVRDWMVDDDVTFDFACGRFWLSARFDVEFDKWMEGQRP